MKPAEIKPTVTVDELERLDYPDGVTPVLAMPERPVPNGARAG